MGYPWRVGVIKGHKKCVPINLALLNIFDVFVFKMTLSPAFLSGIVMGSDQKFLTRDK